MGFHCSPRRGVFSEFCKHALYAPGDNLRHLDWPRLRLLVDASGSMSCTGGTRPSKFAVAQELVAALADIARHQRDACGLTLLSVAVSRGTHWEALLRFLVPTRSSDRHTVVCALRIMAKRERRRGFRLTLSMRAV